MTVQGEISKELSLSPSSPVPAVLPLPGFGATLAVPRPGAVAPLLPLVSLLGHAAALTGTRAPPLAVTTGSGRETRFE